MSDVDEVIARIQREADEAIAAVRGVAPSPTVGGKTIDELRDEADRKKSEDFDAFWASRRAVDAGGKKLRNVLGLDLQLPASLPMRFQVEAQRLQASGTAEDVQYLFGMLFGPSTYDELVERGLDSEMFSVLLMWGSANGAGGDITLDEAAAAYRKMKANQSEGKAVTAGLGLKSSATGRSSNPISRGNTRSRKKKSRR